MKYLRYLIIFLIIFYIIPTSSQPNTNNHVDFSFYDIQNEEWYNLTITDFYYLTSSDPFFNQLKLPFGQDPWYEIERVSSETDFFNINQDQPDNPNFILHIVSGDLENTIYAENFDNGNFDHKDKIINYFSTLLDRLIGSSDEIHSVWPYDSSVVVMESYPEQYRVQSYLVRGMDLLDVGYELNVSLIVSDYDFLAQYFVKPNGSILVVETVQVNLAYGGQTEEVNFSIFSVGEDHLPNELFFTIVIDNKYSLMLSPSGEFFIRTQFVDLDNLNVIDHSDDATNEFDLNYPYLSIIPFLIMLVISRKVYTIFRAQYRN